MVKYRLVSKYVFLHHSKDDTTVVRMWYINGIPFVFDDLPEQQYDPIVLGAAEQNDDITIEELFQKSEYLIQEECHPILFDMEELIENPTHHLPY